MQELCPTTLRILLLSLQEEK